MKTTAAIAFLLFWILPVIDSKPKFIEQKKNELTATYKGKTNDGKYSFVDEKGLIVLFNKISDEVKINLSDKNDLGKKFIITWEYKIIQILSYEGEPEETVTIKLITDLKYFNAKGGSNVQ